MLRIRSNQDVFRYIIFPHEKIILKNHTFQYRRFSKSSRFESNLTFRDVLIFKKPVVGSRRVDGGNRNEDGTLKFDNLTEKKDDGEENSEEKDLHRNFGIRRIHLDSWIKKHNEDGKMSKRIGGDTAKSITDVEEYSTTDGKRGSLVFRMDPKSGKVLKKQSNFRRYVENDSRDSGGFRTDRNLEERLEGGKKVEVDEYEAKLGYAFYRRDPTTGNLVKKESRKNLTDMKEIIGEYAKRSGAMENVERAATVDKILREKILEVWADTPMPTPDDVDIDLNLFESAIAKLANMDNKKPLLPDVQYIVEKLQDFPSDLNEKIKQRRFRYNFSLSDSDLKKLEPSELALLAEHMHFKAVIVLQPRVIRLINEGGLKINDELFDVLANASAQVGNTASVRELMKYLKASKQALEETTPSIEKDRALDNGQAPPIKPIDHSHLIRSLRFEVKKDASKLEEINNFVVETSKKGFDERTYGALMFTYAEADRIDVALALFNNYEKFVLNTPVTTNIIHNALLSTLERGKMIQEADHLFQAMCLRKDIPDPNFKTYSLMSRVYAAHEQFFPKLIKLFHDYLDANFLFDNSVFGAIMYGCARAGRISATLGIFQHVMSQPSVAVYSRLFSDYLEGLLIVVKSFPKVEKETVVIGTPHFEGNTGGQLLEESAKSNEDLADELEEPMSSSDPFDEQELTAPIRISDTNHSPERYKIPSSGRTPETAEELVALIDVQYQHISHHVPHLTSPRNQRSYLAILVKSGFYDAYKNAYKWLALASGLRNQRPVFSVLKDKYNTHLPEVDKSQRFAFDYLRYPLSQWDFIIALNAAYESKDLAFTHSVINDYDQLTNEIPSSTIHNPDKRELINQVVEGMAINSLTQCGDLNLAYKRFKYAMKTLNFDLLGIESWTGRLGQFLGELARRGDHQVVEDVFKTLQLEETPQYLNAKRRYAEKLAKGISKHELVL